MTVKEIDGNLVTLGFQGVFDVIAHGCNCFNKMGKGIAPQMAKAFGCDRYPLESEEHNGDINKLGQIDYDWFRYTSQTLKPVVVNCYTQYNVANRDNPIPFDYEAFTLCMRKMNSVFYGKHIGLPKIGSGLAGGNWDRIKAIIQKELIHCQVTIVNYKP